MKKLFLLICMLTGIVGVQAQTSYTSKINNPSFENDTEGWVHKGMSARAMRSSALRPAIHIWKSGPVAAVPWATDT